MYQPPNIDMYILLPRGKSEAFQPGLSRGVANACKLPATYIKISTVHPGGSKSFHCAQSLPQHPSMHLERSPLERRQNLPFSVAWQYAHPK
jgi:hypothetical protein